MQKHLDLQGFLQPSTTHKSTVYSILDEAEIKPFRIKYYNENRDPWIYRCAEIACPVFWKSPVRKEEITVLDR